MGARWAQAGPPPGPGMPGLELILLAEGRRPVCHRGPSGAGVVRGSGVGRGGHQGVQAWPGLGTGGGPGLGSVERPGNWTEGRGGVVRDKGRGNWGMRDYP